MEPVVIDRSQHPVSRKDISPEALKVLYRLKNAGFIAYLAGGSVRDLLLGRKPKDFDVVTDAHPHQIKKLFRNCRLVGRRFRLAHVYFPGGKFIEVSTFRARIPPDAPQTSRHHAKTPEGVVIRDNVFGTPPEDAQRRDFTVNALFYNIADFSIVDYVGGLKDLDERRLRVIGDPRERFAEDPVRMLRAVRFSASLEFTLEESARQALLEMREQLALASRERLHEEMLKIFFCPRAAAVQEQLWETGLFAVLFPDVAAWLEGNEAGRDWMRRAFRQFERWTEAGVRPSEGLAWALWLGDWLESLVPDVGESAGPRSAELLHAASEALQRPTHRVQIPRPIAHRAAEIVAAQPHFAQTTGRAPERFMNRTIFGEALVYFKFAAKARGVGEERVAWWTQFLKEHPPRGEQKPSSQSASSDPVAADGTNII